MNKKKLAIMIGVIVVILAVILVAVLTQKPTMDKTGKVFPTGSSKVNSNGNSAVDIVGDVNATDLNNGSVTQNAPAPTPVVASPLAAFPGSENAPKQEVVATNEIPAQAIKLKLTNDGFSPKEFTVKAGTDVKLAITGTGDGMHVFIFPNAALMGLTVMVSEAETKVITFKAPAAGSYSFRDDIPSFRDNTGTMIVK